MSKQKCIRNIQITVCVCILGISMIFSHAHAIFGLDRALLNMYYKVTSSRPEKDTVQGMEVGNIYTMAYNMAINNKAQKNLNAIEKTKDYLNQQKGNNVCTMTYNEVVVILYQNSSIRGDIQHLLGESIPGNTDMLYDKLFQSCQKYLACTYPGVELHNTNNMQGLQQCITETTQAFVVAQRNFGLYNEMTQSNYGENIFLDGDPDNGPYDLLVDIQNIGDILFKENKQVARGIFFEMPNVGPANRQNTTQTLSSTGAQGGSNNTDNNPVTASEGESDNAELSNQGTNQVANQNNDPNNVQNIIATIDDANNIQSTTPPVPQPGQGALALADACILPDGRVIDDENLSNEEIIAILDDVYRDLSVQRADLAVNLEQPLIASDLPIANDPIFTPEVGTGLDTNDGEDGEKKPEETKPSVCEQSCQSKTNQRDKALCEVSCCTQTCTANYKGADRLICMSQCLCKEVSGPLEELNFRDERTPQFRYKVRFCRIPVQIEPIVPKKVESIEAVLDEINIVLKATRESGELMKHVKTKEMFETSMQNIKLADILGFNFFFKLKPIFPVNSLTDIDQKRERDNEIRERDLLQVGSIEEKKERNKYIVSTNTVSADATASPSTSFQMLSQQIINAETQNNQRKYTNMALIHEASHDKFRALFGDEIIGFIQNNGAFWHEVTETLLLFNDGAKDLHTTIKKAPN